MGRRKLLEDSELLAVARDAFVEQGFGASTRNIARRAGVSETVLFQRFRTKSELFFAAMVPPAPDIHAILVSQSARQRPSIQFEVIAARILRYFRQVTPVLIPLMSHPGFNYDVFIERYPESPLNQLVQGLRAWLAWLENRDVLVRGRADAMAMTLVMSMASLALFEHVGAHAGGVEDDLVREVTRLIWRGGSADDHH